MRTEPLQLTWETWAHPMRCCIVWLEFETI